MKKINEKCQYCKSDLYQLKQISHQFYGDGSDEQSNTYHIAVCFECKERFYIDKDGDFIEYPFLLEDEADFDASEFNFN